MEFKKYNKENDIENKIGIIAEFVNGALSDNDIFEIVTKKYSRDNYYMFYQSRIMKHKLIYMNNNETDPFSIFDPKNNLNLAAIVTNDNKIVVLNYMSMNSLLGYHFTDFFENNENINKVKEKCKNEFEITTLDMERKRFEKCLKDMAISFMDECEVYYKDFDVEKLGLLYDNAYYIAKDIMKHKIVDREDDNCFERYFEKHFKVEKMYNDKDLVMILMGFKTTENIFNDCTFDKDRGLFYGIYQMKKIKDFCNVILKNLKKGSTEIFNKHEMRIINALHLASNAKYVTVDTPTECGKAEVDRLRISLLNGCGFYLKHYHEIKEIMKIGFRGKTLYEKEENNEEN